MCARRIRGKYRRESNKGHCWNNVALNDKEPKVDHNSCKRRNSPRSLGFLAWDFGLLVDIRHLRVPAYRPSPA